MAFPSTSAIFAEGSMEMLPFPAVAPPPVLQATKLDAARARTCKTRLFMRLSRKGGPRTLGRSGPPVNRGEERGISESQPRRNQGLPAADPHHRRRRTLAGPRPAFVQRGDVPTEQRLQDRARAAGRRRDPRRGSLPAASRTSLP